MAKLDARDWITEISDGATTPVWSEITGLNTFTPNWSENEEVADTTTFESGGEYEQQVMQRGANLELAGFHKTDGAGARDPGQEQAETLAAKVGDESVGQIRFRHVKQTEWTVWNATATLGEGGGGNNAKTAWNVTFVKSGPATTQAVS